MTVKANLRCGALSNQTWYVIYSSTGLSVHQQWGASGDIPAPGAYDGDEKTDIDGRAGESADGAVGHGRVD